MKTFPVTLLVIVSTLFQMANGIPLDESLPPTPPTPMATRSGMFAMDNFTGPACTTSDELPLTRSGQLNTYYRWRGNFNVYLDPAFDQTEIDNINRVMYDLWQLIPCVRFGIFPRGTPPYGDYVNVVRGTNNGCNSHVGRQGGRQDMNLQSPGCSKHYGSTVHEFLHALGFSHQQCRPDRDDYVTIHWDNIIPKYKFAFNKCPTSEVTTFGVPYNHQSIMHYHGHDFTRNGQRTITARNGESVGSYTLQESDKQGLRLMYGC